MSKSSLLLSCLFLAAFSGCSQAGGGSGNEPPGPAAPGVSAAHALEAAIGGAECQEDKECKLVPVGHKACGGPAGFRAYSTRGGKEAEIEHLAVQERAAAKAAEKPGMVSDCAIVEPPYVSCRAGHCAVGGADR